MDLVEIDPSGVAIQVTQNASSLMGVDALKHNNLNPRLTVFPDRLVYNILGENTVAFSDVELVDLRYGLLRPMVRVRQRGGLDYVGAPSNEADLIRLLQLLDGRVPLGERARSRLTTSADGSAQQHAQASGSTGGGDLGAWSLVGIAAVCGLLAVLMLLLVSLVAVVMGMVFLTAP